MVVVLAAATCVVLLVAVMLIVSDWAKHLAEKDLQKFIGPNCSYSHPLVTFDCGRMTLRSMGIANLLGAFRFATGFVVALIYVGQMFGEHSNLVALVVATLAILTDLFDGATARRRKETTAFGEKLDAVADKSIQYLSAVGVIIELANAGVPEELMHPLLLVCYGVTLLRELVLLVVWRYTRCDPKPHAVSKIRSGLLATTIMLVALYLVLPYIGRFLVVPAIVVFVGFLAVYSLISMAVEMYRMIRRSFD